MSNGSARKSIFGTALKLLKVTAEEWLDDKAPQLGAALAFYTVLSLAPLVLILLAIIGMIFRHDPGGAGHCADSFDPREEYARHDHRDCSRPLRRKRSVWTASGCVEHDLGRKSQTGAWHLGIFARPLFVVCDDCRSLFFTAGVTRNRGAAKRV